MSLGPGRKKLHKQAHGDKQTDSGAFSLSLGVKQEANNQ